MRNPFILGEGRRKNARCKEIVYVTLKTNGYCGTDDPKTTDVDESETVTWNYNTDTKAITIAGSGPMMYYNSVQNGENWNNGAPWRALLAR